MKVSADKKTHRGETRIVIVFQYDKSIIGKVKQISGAKWSKTLKAWHIPYNATALDALIAAMGDENLELSANVSALVKTKERHERQNSVKIDVVNRKIRIFLPKNDEDIQFIRSLRYSRWQKNDYCWEVPDYPGNLNLIKDYFGERIVALRLFDSMDVKAGATGQQAIKRHEVLFLKTKSGRVKVFAFFNKTLIHAIKQIPYSRWDANNKWWTIPYAEQFMTTLKAVCEDQKLEVIRAC